MEIDQKVGVGIKIKDIRIFPCFEEKHTFSHLKELCRLSNITEKRLALIQSLQKVLQPQGYRKASTIFLF